MFCNDGGVTAVIVGRVVEPPTLLKFPQRFDSMVGNNKQISVFVYVLQDLSEHFVEGAVLGRECIDTNTIHRWVIASIVGLNRIKPVSNAILAGLNKHREVGAMMA